MCCPRSERMWAKRAAKQWGGRDVRDSNFGADVNRGCKQTAVRSEGWRAEVTRFSFFFFFFLPFILSNWGLGDTHTHTYTHVHTLPSAEKAPQHKRPVCAHRLRGKTTATGETRTIRFARLLDLDFYSSESSSGAGWDVLLKVRRRAMSAKHFRTPSRCSCSPCLPPDPFAFPFLCESSAHSERRHFRIGGFSK